VSRSSALARTLRNLKIEHDELLERKAQYDFDTNRAVTALAKFNRVVEQSKTPDNRRSVQQAQPDSSPPSNPPIPEEMHEDTVDDRPKWAKKAYRQIALRTHPDRVGPDENLTDAQRERMVELYREATDAYQTGNYDVLAQVAAELDIQLDLPDAEIETALEKKIASIRKEIEGMQRTLSWVWGTSFGDLPIRVLVLRRCCTIMEISAPDEKTLIDIVKELEAQPEFDVIDRLGRVKRIKSGADRRKLGVRPEKRIR
jgi:hypothetical protein